ncbi:acyl-CoA carboxylase subunit epsilon, partial [Streptomyces sp. RCPT1-4]|nr:acyl-CoA carboxylase subunit epsilon [Streptomyces sennicomposti]
LAAALAVVRARAVAAAALPSGAPGPHDSWADPSRIAAQGVPRPGPAAWARTYWPA